LTLKNTGICWEDPHGVSKLKIHCLYCAEWKQPPPVSGFVYSLSTRTLRRLIPSARQDHHGHQHKESILPTGAGYTQLITVDIVAPWSPLSTAQSTAPSEYRLLCTSLLLVPTWCIYMSFQVATNNRRRLSTYAKSTCRCLATQSCCSLHYQDSSPQRWSMPKTPPAKAITRNSEP
jgi:hypothetical protein